MSLLEAKRAIAIIQARMTSTRLPGKVLMDLAGRPALEQMLRRVRQSVHLDDVIVATTVNATDGPVVELCERLGVSVFRGDEMDVLGRFHAAAIQAEADIVVRLTGDCPMHDATIIDLCLERFREGDCDYCSNVIHRSYPDGLDTEVLTIDTLARCDREAVSDYWREHVTTYIRDVDNPGDFLLDHFVGAEDYSELRWTLDTEIDLKRIRTFFDRLPDRFSWREALYIDPLFEILKSEEN